MPESIGGPSSTNLKSGLRHRWDKLQQEKQQISAELTVALTQLQSLRYKVNPYLVTF